MDDSKRVRKFGVGSDGRTILLEDSHKPKRTKRHRRRDRKLKHQIAPTLKSRGQSPIQKSWTASANQNTPGKASGVTLTQVETTINDSLARERIDELKSHIDGAIENEDFDLVAELDAILYEFERSSDDNGNTKRHQHSDEHDFHRCKCELCKRRKALHIRDVNVGKIVKGHEIRSRGWTDVRQRGNKG